MVNKLKPKLSSEHDDISTKLLKLSIASILLPITHMINRSFSAGIFPNKIKVAKVLPIHKSLQRLFKRTLSVKITTVKVKSFECMDACITSGGEIIRLIVVCKLHPKKGTRQSEMADLARRATRDLSQFHMGGPNFPRYGQITFLTFRRPTTLTFDLKF